MTRPFLPLLLLALFVHSLSPTSRGAEPRYNVLFIAVDDLRPELGCYGHPQVKSPHIDRLAAEGTLFRRAYCQQAVCNPSRASLMTGIRPESLGVLDLPTHFRDKRPDVVTIAQLFKQSGYHTQRVGKIYHTGQGNHDDPLSWSVTEQPKAAPRYGPVGTKAMNQRRQSARQGGVADRDKLQDLRGPAWEMADVDDEGLTDGGNATHGIELLRQHRDEPFFIAVGFANPHLPFVAPKKYWDMYDPDTIQLADNPDPPRGSPQYAHTSWGEMRRYIDIPAKGPLSEQQARTAIHGYWAATSYVDAQVGRLLDELDRLKLRDKTIVILWGDHGWQLGEHGFWCKHTNYEVAARAPLIISVPGQRRTGVGSDRLVEFVDIYPTLAQLCSLPAPAGLEGHSFVPLLDDPQQEWKRAAFHVYPRSERPHGQLLGRAIRTDRYRLVEWANKSRDFVEYELYDLQADPDENNNLALQTDYAELIKGLAARIEVGWQGELPE